MKRILYVGHITQDLVSGGVMAGGSVLYGGVVALHAGIEVEVVTRCEARAIPADVGLRWSVEFDPATTTFENRYEGDGTRTQWVHAQAAPIEVHDPSGFDFVHLAPVLNEINLGAWIQTSQNAGVAVAVSLQGILRQLVGKRPWSVVASTEFDLDQLKGADIVFLSHEDLHGATEWLRRLRKHIPMVVLTNGVQGAQVFAGDALYEVGVFESQVVDPTGAGDAFAAGFLSGFMHGKSIENAAKFGAAAASIMIEHAGIQGAEFLDEMAARAKTVLVQKIT